MDRNCHHTVASGHGSEETEEEKTGEISYQKSSGKRVGDLPFILSGQKIDFLFLLRKISPTRAAASPWTVQVMKGAAERERERLAKQVSLSFFLSVPVCLPACLCVSFFCLYICNVCVYRRVKDINSAIERGLSARTHTSIFFYV